LSWIPGCYSKGSACRRLIKSSIHSQLSLKNNMVIGNRKCIALPGRWEHSFIWLKRRLKSSRMAPHGGFRVRVCLLFERLSGDRAER
jgi:hypothetical protein